jgi:hypothetical protein
MIILKEKSVPRGHEANVLTLITGRVIIQIITVAISPIFTHLFSPSAVSFL